MSTQTAEKPAELEDTDKPQSGRAIVESRQAPAPAHATAEASIFSLIARAASDPNVNMDKFERLLAMQEKVEARAAQIAFNAALAAAKSEIEPIVRNTTGHNSKKFADLSAIARGVDHIIGKHGLSYRFRTSQPGPISVTCILSHRDGHAEENTLSGPPDKTGNKNDVQAIGSTQTYLMRYTLMGALGLAATPEDDGQNVGKAAPAIITDAQAEEIENLIDETNSETTAMLAYVGAKSVVDMTAAQYAKAKAALIKKKAAVKAKGGAA